MLLMWHQLLFQNYIFFNLLDFYELSKTCTILCDMVSDLKYEEAQVSDYKMR